MKKFLKKILLIFIPLLSCAKLKIKSKTINKELEKSYNKKKLKKTFIADEIKLKLSIIVPVYNSADFLDFCLGSLVNQITDYDYEVIVVDDGSTDGSYNIIKKYADSCKFLKYSCQQNKGAATARNTGLKMSTGEYIGFVDSDDFVSKNFVTIMLQKALTTKADVVKCNYNYFDEQGVFKVSNNHCKLILKKDFQEIHELDGYVWNSIYKRKIFEKIQFPDGYKFEDMIVKLCIFNIANSILLIDEPLYYFRKQPNSTSRNQKNYENYSVLDQLYLPFELIDFHNIIINSQNLSSLLDECSSYLWYRTRYLSNKEKKAVFYTMCGMLDKYDSILKKYSKNDYYKCIIKAVDKKDYILWKFVSIVLYYFR